MKREHVLLIAGAAALFFAGRARANSRINPSLEISYPVDYSDWWGPEDMPNDDQTLPETPPSVETREQRLDAFLWMIGAAETTPAAMINGDAYFLFYGMTLFSDTSDHPAITGERRGVPLPDEWCAAAGFGPGCVSTAAGAWQINAPTWREVRAAGVWGPRLPDFSPESQREAARRVLILAGALDYVYAGDFDRALQYASKRWASLAGSKAGQPTRSYERLAGFYNQALEQFA